MSPLNLKAFQQEIEQKADELESLPGVIGRVSFQSDKSRKKEITQLEAALGRPLPIFIRAYYEQIGRLNISWKYQDPANPHHKVFGACMIFGPAQMLRHPDPSIDSNQKPKYERLLWLKGDDEKLVNRLQSLFIFDELRYDNYVLIAFPPDGAEAELYLYTRPHDLSKLALTAEQYIRLSLKARGMYLWQQYCLDDSEPNIPLLPDNFQENMRQLFPEVDLANFGHGKRKTLPYETTVPWGDVRYLARVEQMMSDLKTDNRLEGVEFQFNRINPGVHPADVHRAFVALGFALPTEVLTWYQEVNGLSLRWQERGKNGMAADFALLTLEDIFAGFDPSGLEWVRRREWDFSAADHYVQLGAQAKALRGLKDYRVLYREERSDVLIRFGGDKCALLLVVDDDTYPLRLSFCEFVEQLLRFRGVKYWAYFFAQADPYAELGVPKGYLEKVKKLFPD